MKKILYWILAALPALAYFAASFAKLSGSEMMSTEFVHFGYPVWFMYFIGACELLGALGLLFGSLIDRRLPRLAGLGLIIIMLGAIGSHIKANIVSGDPLGMAIPATVLLLVLLAFEYVAMLKDKTTLTSSTV